MRFLIIPTPATNDTNARAEEAFDAELFTAQMKYNEEMHKAGVLVASEGLNPAAHGAHVTIIGGKRTVVDGPFAETKELVAGFWLIDVKSKEEAIAWATRCPIGPRDEVLEIRQLTGPADIPPELVQLIVAAAPSWSSSFAEGR
jgi:hypothetical protein